MANSVFETHAAVVHIWAFSVWDAWASRFLLEISVYGSVAALLASLRRLTWTIESAMCLHSDSAQRVDLCVDSLAFGFSIVRESMSRWRCGDSLLACP